MSADTPTINAAHAAQYNRPAATPEPEQCASTTGGGRYRCKFPAGHAGRHQASGVLNTWTDAAGEEAEEAEEAITSVMQRLHANYGKPDSGVSRESWRLVQEIHALQTELAAEMAERANDASTQATEMAALRARESELLMLLQRVATIDEASRRYVLPLQPSGILPDALRADLRAALAPRQPDTTEDRDDG